MLPSLGPGALADGLCVQHPVPPAELPRIPSGRDAFQARSPLCSGFSSLPFLPSFLKQKNTGLKTETELGVCSKKHLGNSVSSRGAPPSGGRGWVSLPPGWPGAVSAVDSGLCTHHQVGMATHTPVPRLLLLLVLLAPHRIQPTGRHPLRASFLTQHGVGLWGLPPGAKGPQRD